MTNQTLQGVSFWAEANKPKRGEENARSFMLAGMLAPQWRQAVVAQSKIEKSGHPESNQGPSDCCSTLQSDALPTEL